METHASLLFFSCATLTLFCANFLLVDAACYQLWLDQIFVIICDVDHFSWAVMYKPFSHNCSLSLHDHCHQRSASIEAVTNGLLTNITNLPWVFCLIDRADFHVISVSSIT